MWSRISRRSVLRGFGASIALPWLEITAGQTLAAQHGARDPGRLACFYIPGAINQVTLLVQNIGNRFSLVVTGLGFVGLRFFPVIWPMERSGIGQMTGRGPLPGGRNG